VRRASVRVHGVTVEEVERILAHDDSQVVLGLGEQPVRVDELESVGRFQGVPLPGTWVTSDSLMDSVRSVGTAGAERETEVA
jgi:hypothetical protein